MLNVDISNIWCSVSLPTLLESEQEIARAHSGLMEDGGAGSYAWLDQDTDAVLERLDQAAASIREMAQTLVVVGSDGASRGVQALLELLRGRRTQGGLRVLFAGEDLSTRAWQALADQLEGQDFCIHLLGASGDAVPAAVATRALRWLLDRRYGTEKSRERVFVTTDPHDGFLRALSAEEGYTAFNLEYAPGRQACPLAPGALLSLAAAGVEVRKILEGAAEARAAMEIRSFENPAWLYAGARTILARRGKRVEYLSTAEPDARTLCRWWQRLFGSRACFGGGGLFPAAAEIPADLPQLGGMLADGAGALMQTVLRFDPPEHRVPVEMDWKNLDGMNDLEGFTLDYVQEQAIAGAIQAGADGSVPIVTVECGPLDACTAGSLMYFFELSSCLCAGMMGRDLHQEEAPAAWEKTMLQLLGKTQA